MTLRYSHAECYMSDSGRMAFKPLPKDENAVLISSEALSDDKNLWKEVPENHCIFVKEDLSVDIRPLA